MAIVVDACVSGAPAGTLRRFDVSRTSLPAHAVGLSSHAFGLSQAIDLGHALRVMPPRCYVYALEGGSFDYGAPMSPAVSRAVDRLVDDLQIELASLLASL